MIFSIYADGNLFYDPEDTELRLISPKLTVEMGKAGSLEFGVPPTNVIFQSLRQLKTGVTVELDGEEIFRGRVLSRQRNFNNVLATYCEGDLAYLIDSCQRPAKYTGTAHALFRSIVAAHNTMVEAEKRFTVGNITVADRSVVLAGQSDDVESLDTDAFNYKQIVINSITDEWMTSLDYIKTSLLDYCGGYLRTRRVGNTTYLDWIAEYYDTASQEIELGINMLDLTEEVSVEDLFTVLIPLGDDNLTIESVNNGSKELVDATAVERYGRIVKTHVFSNVNTAATLLENGQRYLADKTSSVTTLTVKAVDMHFLDDTVEAIHLGDRVRIYSAPHGLTGYLTCTRIEYDLANPANNTYTFGNPKQTLTERYREDKRKQSDTYSSGGSGGAAAAAAEHDWHLVDEVVSDAVETVTEETDQKLSEFFDAWINVDPEAGNINLGALYEKYEDDRLVLKNNVGIDLDAPSGTINVYTVAATANDAESKCASIILWAGTDAQGNLGSNIALNADLVTVSDRLEAVEGVFESITSESITISRYLRVARIYASGFVEANNFYDNNAIQAGNRLAAKRHTHNIVVGNNGTLKIGDADLDGGEHFFNIADTQIYKDGVSAAHNAGAQTARIDSVTLTTVNAHRVIGSGHYIDLQIDGVARGTYEDGTYYTSGSLRVSNGRLVDVGTVYSDGYAAGQAAADTTTAYNNGYSAGRNSVSIREVRGVGTNYVRVILSNDVDYVYGPNGLVG